MGLVWLILLPQTSHQSHLCCCCFLKTSSFFPQGITWNTYKFKYLQNIHCNITSFPHISIIFEPKVHLDPPVPSMQLLRAHDIMSTILCNAVKWKFNSLPWDRTNQQQSSSWTNVSCWARDWNYFGPLWLSIAYWAKGCAWWAVGRPVSDVWLGFDSSALCYDQLLLTPFCDS